MMIAVLKDVLERTESWPADAQRELAEMVLEMEAAMGASSYVADADELDAIDDADSSGLASEVEIDAAFAAFRRT